MFFLTQEIFAENHRSMVLPGVILIPPMSDDINLDHHYA